MSQKDTFRIKALEERVNALEERLALLEPPAVDADLPPFRAVHRGFGHYFVETPDGTRINEQGLSKDDADAMARDLMEQLGRMN